MPVLWHQRFGDLEEMFGFPFHVIFASRLSVILLRQSVTEHLGVAGCGCKVERTFDRCSRML